MMNTDGKSRCQKTEIRGQMIDYKQFAISDFWPLSSDLRLHHLEFNCPMAYIYLLASNGRIEYRLLQKCQKDDQAIVGIWLMDSTWSSAPLQKSIAEINLRIQQACLRAGRDPAEVTLVAVTKTFPAEAIAKAVEAGVPDIGENYVQELLEKQKPTQR